MDPVLALALKRSEKESKKATISLLIRELGWVRALGVALSVQWDLVRGRPFQNLPKATAERDILSRRQIGPAIILYEKLRTRVDQKVAFRLTREAVIGGGAVFLRELLSDIDPARDAVAGGAEDRLKDLSSRFFNAEGALTLEGATGAAFHVRRCIFVELVAHAGAPELGPLFCEVDSAFFKPEFTPLRLRRTQTIATGSSACDFRFDWSPPPR